ncbi:MAG: hypothetical protein MUC41_07595 [Syntrophobacteraceae bacterium]|jgi:hypothetical protein|nr:hypothetical protein [Syntrophobacteraceae bacterium]
MKLDQATWWRSTLGRAGALFCILFILSGLDGLVAQFRTPPNEVRAIPGEKINVNGPCSPDIQDLSQLVYDTSAEGIQLQLEALHSGFWLGGTMWRGQLVLSSDLRPGTYGVMVRSGIDPNEKPFALFVIQVFSSPDELRQTARSFILRRFGITPWIAFFVFISLALLTFALTYYVTQQRDSMMAEQGLAEVYRVAMGGEGCREVAFGLGSTHGVQAGDLVTLMNPSGERVGKVKVIQVFDVDSIGTVDLETMVRPGFVVAKDH